MTNREQRERQEKLEQHQEEHDIDTCQCLDAKVARWRARAAG